MRLHAKILHGKLSAMTLSLLIAGLIAGCTTRRYAVISSDREILRAKKGQSLVPFYDGWFVPDAVWLDMNEALARKMYENKTDGAGGAK